MNTNENSLANSCINQNFQDKTRKLIEANLTISEILLSKIKK